jgi:hypothetical protein
MKGRVPYVLIGVLAWLGCGAPKPVQHVIQEFGGGGRPHSVATYISEERDLTGVYHQRISALGQESVSDRLRAALADSMVIYEKKSVGGGRTYRNEYSNIYRVVSDSTEAEIILRITIEAFRFIPALSKGQQFWGSFGAPPKEISLIMHTRITGTRPSSSDPLFELKKVELARAESRSAEHEAISAYLPRLVEKIRIELTRD